MTASRKQLARRGAYNQQEHDVLLHGIPLHAQSTRFGHWKLGWHREEIALAWELLRDELLPRWASDEFADDRKQHSRPWAERFLAQVRDP